MTSGVDVQTQESCLSDRDVNSEARTIFHAGEFVSGRSETGFRIEYRIGFNQTHKFTVQQTRHHGTARQKVRSGSQDQQVKISKFILALQICRLDQSEFQTTINYTGIKYWRK